MKAQKGLLMRETEPTDSELSMLMKEVAQEAKVKAVLAHEKLAERMLEEMRIAQAKFNANL